MNGFFLPLKKQILKVIFFISLFWEINIAYCVISDDQDKKHFEGIQDGLIFIADLNKNSHAAYGSSGTLIGPQLLIVQLYDLQSEIIKHQEPLIVKMSALIKKAQNAEVIEEYVNFLKETVKKLEDPILPFKIGETINIGQEKYSIKNVIWCKAGSISQPIFLVLDRPVKITPAYVKPWDFDVYTSGYLAPHIQCFKEIQKADYNFEVGMFSWEVHKTKEFFAQFKNELFFKLPIGSHPLRGGGFVKFDLKKREISSISGIVSNEPTTYRWHFPNHREQFQATVVKETGVPESVFEENKNSTCVIRFFDQEDSSYIHFINLKIALGEEVKEDIKNI